VCVCVCVSDCPQVQCVEQYIAQQTDELALEPTEIVNIVRKTNEGKNEEGRGGGGLTYRTSTEALTRTERLGEMVRYTIVSISSFPELSSAAGRAEKRFE